MHLVHPDAAVVLWRLATWARRLDLADVGGPPVEYHAILRAEGATPIEVSARIGDLHDPAWTATAWHKAGPPFISLTGESVAVVTVELRSDGWNGWSATAEMHPQATDARDPTRPLSQVVLLGLTAFSPPG